MNSEHPSNFELITTDGSDHEQGNATDHSTDHSTEATSRASVAMEVMLMLGRGLQLSLSFLFPVFQGLYFSIFVYHLYLLSELYLFILLTSICGSFSSEGYSGHMHV